MLVSRATPRSPWPSFVPLTLWVRLTRSRQWAKQFKTGEMGIKDESDLRGEPTAHH